MLIVQRRPARADVSRRTHARIVRILVRRDVQHRWVVVKHRFSAVAVVHVVVDDQDALDSVPNLGVARGDGDVSQRARPHAVIGHSVMSRRPNRRQPIAGCSFEHPVDRADDTASRQQRDRRPSGPTYVSASRSVVRGVVLTRRGESRSSAV